MTKRLNRYVFATGMAGTSVRKTVIYAVTLKQAKFFLYDMAIANGAYLACAELIDMSGTYPGDVVAVWNVESKTLQDRVVR